MKKNFKLYLVAWAIVLALFNVISFVVPASCPPISKSDAKTLTFTVMVSANCGKSLT